MRPTDGNLEGEGRDLNHRIARVRITVENGVGEGRPLRMCREFYRNETRRHGRFWDGLAGLVNIRTMGGAPRVA